MEGNWPLARGPEPHQFPSSASLPRFISGHWIRLTDISIEVSRQGFWQQ